MSFILDECHKNRYSENHTVLKRVNALMSLFSTFSFRISINFTEYFRAVPLPYYEFLMSCHKTLHSLLF